jgi:uncharacterized 2Fe-2S/4Fe-4S cluster protein (DUF4445 family)
MYCTRKNEAEGNRRLNQAIHTFINVLGRVQLSKLLFVGQQVSKLLFVGQQVNKLLFVGQQVNKFITQKVNNLFTPF